MENISLSSTSSALSQERMVSNTEKMNEMYWKNMDMILEKYKKENPDAYNASQKKGEELMNFDYNNPYAYVNDKEKKEYGKKVCNDITYNGLLEKDLSEYDKECWLCCAATKVIKSLSRRNHLISGCRHTTPDAEQGTSAKIRSKC